jgi:hypothetical protein
VLVRIAHDRAVGGVVLDAGTAWLTDDVTRGAASSIDGWRATVMGLALDETLQGGLLPPNAVAAHVVDDAGVRRVAAAARGAWVVLLDRECDGRVSPVCFTDAAGALVVPPLAARWARAPVDDADEPCPACGETGWDEVWADDDSRGRQGPDMEPIPFVACRACGHEHTVGVFSVGETEDDARIAGERERLMAAARTRMRDDARAVLKDVPFVVYAARDHPGRVDGWGSSNGVTSQITVAHGSRSQDRRPHLRVITEQEPHAYESDLGRARSTLAGALHEELGPWPLERSHAGIAIWLHVRERELLARATLALAEQRTFRLDDEPAAFVAVASAERWVAVRRHGDLTITIEARDVDPGSVELYALADPLADLAAPEIA